VAGGGALGAHIEFDGALELDDGFGMMAIFEQRIADGLRAVDEQAAKEAILFLDDPVAAAIAADKDNGGCRAARWRFDELHVGIPSGDEWGCETASPVLAISSGADMNSRAASRRSHRSGIRSVAI
jgi:hypothetical protein